MTKSDSSNIHSGIPKNPFAPPSTMAVRALSESEVRLRAVTRVYRIIGWLGIVIYVPIVLTCLGSLVGILLGYRIGPLLVVAGASVFHSIFLALAILYVLTARRIAERDITVRRRAVVLSFLMMIGFPLFTIVGAICYRYLKLHFHEQGEFVEELASGA